MKLSVKRLFLGSVSAAILGGIVYAFLPKPASADLAPVTRGPLRVTVDHEGRTRVRERFVISAPLAGQVARIGRKEGLPVEAGQTILAVIEPKESELLDPSTRLQTEARVKGGEAAVKQAAHNLERAKEVYKLAQADLARAQRMLSTQSLPQADYDAALYKERGSAQELRAAQFALRVAEFELEQAKAVLLRTRPGSPGDPEDPRFVIRAPVGGKVLRVLQESSAYVTAGTKLLEVGDPADLEVEIDLLTQDAVKVVPGARVLFEHWGGEGVLNGRVRLVEPSGFMKVSALGVEEQRVWVIADFTDPYERWKGLQDEYRVEARIVVWEAEDVLKVPAGALFRHNGGWAVFKVADERAALQPVQVGHSNGLETQILDGLAEGERVIVHPSDKIKDGVAVAGR